MANSRHDATTQSGVCTKWKHVVALVDLTSVSAAAMTLPTTRRPYHCPPLQQVRALHGHLAPGTCSTPPLPLSSRIDHSPPLPRPHIPIAPPHLHPVQQAVRGSQLWAPQRARRRNICQPAWRQEPRVLSQVRSGLIVKSGVRVT